MAHGKAHPRRSNWVQWVRIDPDTDAPVYRQIAEGILAALRQGRIAAGRRLPPTRRLAAELRVNRNTAVAAYRHLEEAGAVRSHTGRGTFLVGPETERAAARPAGPAAVRPAGPAADWSAFSRAVEGPGVGGLLSVYRVATSHEGISFAASHPAADLLPVEPFRAAMDRVLRERGAEALAYGPTAGHAPLREWIAADLRRKGAAVEADDVLITNGSQQAIELVFRAMVDPGDAVVLEDPSYTGALSVLASLGARRVGVPLDEEGIRPDLLARALERHRPRLLYLQPTFHNPTARVMPLYRRKKVLELAARHRCAVVEDDWAADLRLDGGDLPTLRALDGGKSVLHIGTFSKKLLPGLRVGWVVAPRVVVERLVALKQIEDCGTSVLVQAALWRFLDDGGMEPHLRRVREAYRLRRDRMVAALRRHAPRQARYERPDGGLFLWVALPEGADADALFSDARERGVLFSRGSLFHVDGTGRHTLRLTYSAASPAEIDSGIATLGGLMRKRLSAREIAPVAESRPIL
jgi:DNA-binding transcriptional MocR family regulator